MKTAKDWVQSRNAIPWGERCIPKDEIEYAEAIQVDAREQGRREGLEEAAKVCRQRFVGKGPVINDYVYAANACADAIRKLTEKSGGGGGGDG